MRSALELAPRDPNLLAATAAAELQAGYLDEALAHARGGGNTAVAQALIGDIEEKRGRYLEAAQAYQSAVALAPANEQYRIALALELVEHHTFEPAITVLEQAAPLFPRSARIRTLLGVAYYAEQHLEQAEAALVEAVAIDPSLEPAHRYLVQVALESAAAPSPGAVAAACAWNAVACSALKSRAARESGDSALLAEAVAGLKRAPPDSAIARCELGRIYQAGGQWTEARPELEACVRLDPSPQNHYRLGMVYNKLGLPDQAHRQMELRSAAAARLANEVARRESTVQAFQYVLK